MKTFYKLLFAGLIAGTTNNFVWFALTYFVYLSTKSVISTGIVAGIYLVATSLSGFWLGSIVDNHKKKTGILLSSVVTFVFFACGFLILNASSPSAFKFIESPILWFFVVTLLLGSLAGNIYNIAIPTAVTILVPEKMHDKANGMLGTVMGISFALTSVASGFTLAFGGMFWVLVIALLLTAITLVFVWYFIDIPEKKVVHTHEEQPKKIDIKGTIRVVAAIPGLFALIFFNMFNNFLGGVFMALMDAYGLSLVSVQVWGTLFGVLSLGFIFGGLVVAKKGLGKNPLKTLLMANVIMWTSAIFFTIQPSIILLGAGILVWISLFPFIEAAEQTIIQKVVPHERQGRVFGFAQSLEQAASPLTAFFIGPLTQLIFIPFMTTGAGVDLIGGWYGVGAGRGIALVFSLAGTIGLVVTLLALRSKSYKLLSKSYAEK